MSMLQALVRVPQTAERSKTRPSPSLSKQLGLFHELNWVSSSKDVAALVAPKKYQMKPSKQHLRCLREHISLCGEQAAVLTADIFTAQTGRAPTRTQDLVKLHRSRLAIRRQANICRNAICPISWIPNEVLSEIFTHCLPSDHRFSCTVAPLLLLHVCQLWRSIAISTASFWSHLAFWTPISNTDLTCYPLRFLGGWLAHSGRNPLDIFLEQDLVYNHLKFVVEMVLLGHYHQCRHLDIHVTKDSAAALNHFVVLPPGSLITLESLVLEGLDEAYFPIKDTAEPIITAFQNSPQLRKLTTNALDFAFSIDTSTSYADFNLLFLPWGQLTHLMITDFITVNVFVVAISECMGLEFLRVSVDLGDDDVFIDMDEWRPDEPVALLSLTELHISTTDGACIPSAMNAIVFPALKRLHFRRSESEEFDDSEPFSWERSPHFLRQLRDLQYLALVGCVGKAEEVLVLLQNTPQVTHLRLDARMDYRFLVPTLFPPLDPDTSCVLLAGPLSALAHLAFRLTKQDFPFPSHCIRNTVDSLWPNCPLVDLTIAAPRGCLQQLQKISSQFTFTPLQTVIGTPGGPIGKATRVRTDRLLINSERASRLYTIVDPMTTLVNVLKPKPV